MPPQKKTRVLASRCAGVTIPELEQSKAAVLSTLASAHSRRSYKHAIEKFIDWYCSEPRLGFNRSVVLRYRAFLEGLTLQQLRSIFIFPRSDVWQMRLRRAAG